MPSLLDFTDRHVVVTGAASGIGAATVDLLLDHGAVVHTIDVAAIEAPVATRHECDLGDRDAIDAVVGSLPATIDALMNCAGIPNGGRFTAEQVMRVNWLGLRHLTESVLPRLGEGSAVVHVASTAGRGWPDNAAALAELMGASSFEAGLDWMQRNAEICGDGYAFSKEAVQYYTMWRALQTATDGVRMNSICPGVTNTALAEDFRRGVGPEVIDRALAVTGRMAEPAEMAPALLFLADDASSSYINGLNLDIDRGTSAARSTGNP